MKPWVALSIFTVSTSALFANGGGYFRGGIDQTGDLTAFEPHATENIRMVDEKLTIDFGKVSAGVEIHYVLKNQTNEKVNVRFGFPVEELFDIDEMDADPEDSSSEISKKKDLKYCQNYTITAREKAISAKWQEEKKPAEGNKDERMSGIEGWLISELDFAPEEEISVTIRFNSGYPAEVWNVSDDSSKSASIFKYRLSTAAVWAGTIGAGKIVLRPHGIPATDLKVLKPANRFQKSGDEWIWEFKDLEPTLADDFEVEAVPEERSFMRAENDPSKSEGPFVDYIDKGGKWSMAHSNYTITASSTLAPSKEASYEADHVKNVWSENAWSEGAKGSGIGEWLELKPEAPKPLTAISILPGYVKDKTLFKANARPKKILVELNGEHRFSVDIPDSSELFEFPVIGYTEPVRSIKLTFEDIWKGTRHEDLCVSGIRLHVELNKAPKIQPAR